MATIKKYNGSTWENTIARKYETKSEIIVPPTTIYADGSNITTYTIKGNTEQNGTPTPSNPVEVVGVGERTENLASNLLVNDTSVQYATILMFDADLEADTTYTLSFTASANIRMYMSEAIFTQATYLRTVEGVNTVTVTTKADLAKTSTNYQNGRWLVAKNTVEQTVSINITNVMLNTGSTAKPFEPYGYKIPISSGQQTTPIYLGSASSTRQIKKYVVTGNETISHYDYDYQRFLLTIPTIPSIGTRLTPIICTHYIGIYDGRPIAQVPMYAVYTGSDTDNSILIKTDQTTDRSTFIAWLQEQYANGTPVTIWYAVSTPETAVVNEPLRKIGDYVDAVSGITVPTITGKDTFDVLTTLKPSEVELTYTGWHDANVKESDGSQWNE